jgi:VWFA-related protein
MRHTNRKSHLLWILLLLLGTAAFAQITLSPKPSSGRQPADFSRLPDPSHRPIIEYHPYDKTLVTFHTSAQYVVVPVVVTDKHGRPVRGLTQGDFRLQENGKERKIASLEEFNSTSLPSTDENNQRPSPNTPKQLVIIALDMVNTPLDDQARARRQLVSYFTGNIEPDCLYQLVSVENNGLRILNDNTQDTAALVTALNAIHNSFPTTHMVDKAALREPDTTDAGRGEQVYAQARQFDAAGSTLLGFQQIAERVSRVPGRKSLVWVTGGLPFSIDPRSASVDVGVAFEAYQHTMHLLSSQMISVYPVDARGVLSLGYDPSDARIERGNGPRNEPLSNESNRQVDIFDTMRAFSDMTGGRAYLNSNDTQAAVRAAVRDGAAYYLLTYPIDKSDRRQGWRKITVKVGDYHVRARKGYFLTKVTADATDL